MEPKNDPTKMVSSLDENFSKFDGNFWNQDWSSDIWQEMKRLELERAQNFWAGVGPKLKLDFGLVSGKEPSLSLALHQLKFKLKNQVTIEPKILTFNHRVLFEPSNITK